MTPDEYDDETLMACADGELDPAAAARVAAAVAADPALARRLAIFTGTRDVLAQAAAARRETGVPDALLARVRETIEAARPRPDAAEVLPFRRPAAAPRPLRPMAIAASLALGVGLAGGLLAGLSLGRDRPAGLRLATLDNRGLAEALSALPSGERQRIAGGEVAMIASFRTADDELCREFEFGGADGATVVSVACRADTGWQMRFAVVAGAAGSGYAPASSLETLDAWMAAVGAGAPLSPEEEAALLAAAD